MVATETEKYTFSTIGGALCLDFANTISSHLAEEPHEHLESYGDLLAWAEQSGALSGEAVIKLAEEAARRPVDAERAFDSALELRRAIYLIFSAVATEKPAPEEAMQMFNAYLSGALAHAKVVNGESGFAWGWVDAEVSLERMLWPVARSAADLLVSGQVERVRECGGHDCSWLFVDTSKNHSRRWCDMGDCGNRAKARRHYHRRQRAESSRQWAVGSRR
jgi:predicted RNA-binding Zn ribbon-like protein